MHAVGASHIAAGGHHAAVATTDDNGHILQFGAVTFLDGSVERVAVQVCNCQVMEFIVANDTPGTAVRAGSGGGRRPGAAVSA